MARVLTAGVPGTYREISAVHRTTLARLAERSGVARMRELYEDANVALTARLRATLRANMGESFTAQSQRVALAQVREGLTQLAPRMANEVLSVGREASDESYQVLIRNIRRLAPEFRGAGAVLPIEEAARFRGAVGRTSSILRSRLTGREGVIPRYTAETIARVEDHLAVSLATGRSTGETIDGVHDAVGGEMYRAERIVRTETAWSYNATHAAGIMDASRDIEGMMMRWSEFVDDMTGEPLDDRVGVDSLAMHGQVTDPGGLFTMPPTSPEGDVVSPSLVGQAWAFPPNRPNDRAVVDPWHASWGTPGWRYVGGARVPVGIASV